MEITGEQLLPLPQQRVWDALLDADALRAAIPGCESVTALGDGVYAIAVVVALGPVKAHFKGKMRQENLQAPHSYELHFEGEGGAAGFARGSAKVSLTPEGQEQTRLTYSAQAQIGGRLAQIGSRLIDATAAKMAAQFFIRFTQYLTRGGADDAAQAAPAAPSPSTPVAGAASSAPAAASPAPASPTPGMVTIQMPAWAWVVTLIVVAALAAYLGSR